MGQSLDKLLKNYKKEYKRIENTIKELNDFVKEMRLVRQDCNEIISNIDQQLSDIKHYIENNGSIDQHKSWLIVKRISKLSKLRRVIKEIKHSADKVSSTANVVDTSCIGEKYHQRIEGSLDFINNPESLDDSCMDIGEEIW